VGDIERAHVEDFIAEQIETRSASTASVRFRALQQFFAWCLDEGELDANPMARMRPPVVPERLVPVLGEADAKALLKACAGPGFVERRDTAIIRLFLDTGMRLNELAKLYLADVGLDDDVAIVVGKGRRAPGVPVRGPHRRRPSTGTCEHDHATSGPTCRLYGWARTAAPP
jgi:integrase/recombinase XerC